ncbi:MAG TPA: 2-phosphosulfolactate phosphatase [Thermotogaceae bacterium]|nr:2-phosphosulfolactate phosphatase [Thermotogaceae bacterium]
MRIRTKVLYYEREKEPLNEYTTVIIDILRASSSITTILSNGASWVKPVENSNEALRIKEKIPDVLLAGEINALRIKGFDFGNSPTEFLNKDLSNKKVVLTTTNGTKAVLTHSNNSEVLIGCFLNINTLVDYLKNKEHILLVCSGSHGEFSLEDFLFCGRLIEKLMINNSIYVLDDASKLALRMVNELGNDLWNFIKGSMHANTLISKNFKRDVEFCFRENVFEIVPFLDEEGFKVKT